ncbi:SGNH hydrolase [Saccharata proteae CBS 121410]|uniref:SGNH hydrolase n=1 Tax=Saccharata proteae CBS 121410 TaxID=1314787 RepID=A0A9P4LUQ9_9PEZI|nr:SGNH hydrolase [Saccharata proteae CBS 121410]
MPKPSAASVATMPSTSGKAVSMRILMLLASAGTTCAAADKPKGQIPRYNTFLEDNWKSYTAIGDSFAAGFGMNTAASYPNRIGEHFPARGRNIVAEVANASSAMAQLETLKFGSPELVTIQIGMESNPALNLRGCFFTSPDLRRYRRYGPNCPYDNAFTAEMFRFELERLVQAVKDYRNPDVQYSNDRTIALLGYPWLLEADMKQEVFEGYCKSRFDEMAQVLEFFSNEEVGKKMNDVTELNRVLEEVAVAKGVLFVDINDSFHNHRFCAQKDPWLEFVYLGGDHDELLLPNDEGHFTMYSTIYKQLWDHTDQKRKDREQAEEDRKEAEEDRKEEEEDAREKKEEEEEDAREEEEEWKEEVEEWREEEGEWLWDERKRKMKEWRERKKEEEKRKEEEEDSD